jgi:hypothetical protein
MTEDYAEDIHVWDVVFFIAFKRVSPFCLSITPLSQKGRRFPSRDQIVITYSVTIGVPNG